MSPKPLCLWRQGTETGRHRDKAMPCRHGDTLGTIGRLHQAAQAGWRLVKIVKWVPMIHPVADGTCSTPSNGTLFILVIPCLSFLSERSSTIQHESQSFYMQPGCSSIAEIKCCLSSRSGVSNQSLCKL